MRKEKTDEHERGKGTEIIKTEEGKKKIQEEERGRLDVGKKRKIKA